MTPGLTDYYRMTHMLLNALLLFLIFRRLRPWYAKRISPEAASIDRRRIIFEANDHGAVQKNRFSAMAHALMKYDERKCLSLCSGSYVMGSNLLGSLCPRYIYLADSSDIPFKLAVDVQTNADIRLSVLKGCIGISGVTYEQNPDRKLTVHKGESFWLGQTEIKVR